MTTSETATAGEDRERVLDLEREGMRNRDPRNLEGDLKGSKKRGFSLDLVELRGRGWRILSDAEKDIVEEEEEEEEEEREMEKERRDGKMKGRKKRRYKRRREGERGGGNEEKELGNRRLF